MAQKKINKKEITFKELCDLVARIDYALESTFPIKFSVVTKNKHSVTSFFEAGIGDSADEEEQQYLGEYHVSSEKSFKKGRGVMVKILDVQEPDAMSFDNIVLLLADRCKITPNSKIYLYEDISFNGEYPCELTCEKTSNGRYTYNDSIPFGNLISDLRLEKNFETLEKFFKVFAPNKKLIENINPQIYSHFLYSLLAMFVAEAKRNSLINPMAIENIFDDHEELSDECLSEMNEFVKDCFENWVLPSKQTWNNFIKRNLK